MFRGNESLMVGPMSLGLLVHSVHRDFSIGALESTGAPLSLALDASGFFEIAHINGLGEVTNMYTRDGNFTLNNEGVLVTSIGMPVLSESGAPIVITGGEIVIHHDGSVLVDGVHIDTIRLVDFEDLATLRPFGDNLYTTTEESVETAFTGNVRQGFIETSNVNIVREMVELISLSRVYETNARMVSIQDQTLGQAVNDIARR